MLSKILKALVALPRLRRKRCRKLVMTLLVKNEEVLLEANLRFHRAMGVDAFIVTDNNSTDATPNILQRYKEKGWITHIIQEPATNYQQKQWVDRMIRIARHELQADWVINADADEFWYCPGGDLKTELAQYSQNIVQCNIRNVYPEDGVPFTQWRQRVEPILDTTGWDLSLYSIFGRQRYKVAHRSDGYLQIGMGNHKVAMLPPLKVVGNILIYHYNIRSREAFIAKMENGGRQFEQHPKKKHGRHWRYFYTLYKEDRLSEEYDRVIGAHDYDRLKAAGYIVDDTTMRQQFAHLDAHLPE